MFNFMHYKPIFFFLSALVIVPGIISLDKYRLRPSIEFTGGALYEMRFSAPIAKDENLNLNDFQIIKEHLESNGEELGEGVSVFSVQNSGEKTYLLKLSPIKEEEKNKINKILTEKFGALEEVRFETIGPLLGRELLIKTLVAVVIASFGIVTYVAWAFKNFKFGISAVLAMFHDTLILLGSFSLLGHFYGVEVDTLFVTAVLTILSFSVHDTIVVFDRIREAQKLEPQADFNYIANKAVSETLVRSLNNSLTILFMLLALILLGGQTIKWFVVALLIGTIAGTYSSPFTAVPILTTWANLANKRKKKG